MANSQVTKLLIVDANIISYIYIYIYIYIKLQHAANLELCLCHNLLTWWVVNCRGMMVGSCEDTLLPFTMWHMGELWHKLCHFIWHKLCQFIWH